MVFVKIENSRNEKITGEDIYYRLKLDKCYTMHILFYDIIEDGKLIKAKMPISIKDYTVLSNFTNMIKNSNSISLSKVFLGEESHTFEFIIKGSMNTNMKYSIKTNQLIVNYGRILSDSVKPLSIEYAYVLIVDMDQEFKDYFKEIIQIEQ